MKNRFTDTDKEKIRQFADDITPKNWNVVLHPKQDRLEPGTLNILLSFKSSEYEVYPDGNGHACYSDERGVETCRRMIPGGMMFMDLKDIGIDRNGKVAQIVIQLWPQYQQMKKVLLQELARIAAIRKLVLETRATRRSGTLVVKERPADDEKNRRAIDRALSLLIRRAIRCYGDKYLEHQML